MSQVGVLLLTAPLKVAIESLNSHFLSASKHVKRKLYVKFVPSDGCLKLSPISADRGTLARFMPFLYTKASNICRNLDVRLILSPHKRCLESPIPVLLTDSKETDLNIREHSQNIFGASCDKIIRLQNISDESAFQNEPEKDFKAYDTAIIGGTFDRIHSGHKIFLSTAVLRATSKLIVGVTTEDMQKRKFLWELITPVDKRMHNLEEFLRDIDPSLEYAMVPIYDTYGPAGSDPDIDCIVVSQETKRGGDKVNERRLELGMKPLELHVIDVLEDAFRDISDEVKVSSSNQRRALLGTYLKTPNLATASGTPLLIALVGGMQCNTRHLQEEMTCRGAFVIDCEDLFLKSLSDNLGELFASDWIDGHGSDTRESVYRMLLDNVENQIKLKSHVSGKMKSIIEAEIDKLGKEGKSIIVLKVPLFLGLECVNIAQEVWGVLTPEENRREAIEKFHKVSPEEATRLLSNDASNSSILDMSHMVFCCAGEAEFIVMQVERAWLSLKSRL